MDDFFVIIQARLGSTRLKNKMAMPFYKSKTIPHIIINRLKNYFRAENIVLATTTNIEDNTLVELAINCGIRYYQGDEFDVLNRFIECCNKFSINKFIRVCADNPFILPKYIEPLIYNLNKSNLEYCSYQWWDKTPIMLSHIGLFTECMTLKFLKRIDSFTEHPSYHEHVTNYLYENLNLFKFDFIELPKLLFGKQYIRLTVDTTEDYKLTKKIYGTLIKENKDIDIKLEQLLNAIDDQNIKSIMVNETNKNAK